MTNALLLKSIPYEEFDYQTLLDAVHGYARPRMKEARLGSDQANKSKL
ncbi:hypothetical protein KVP06_06835 [Geobacter sulfurreducens]|nr:hypothetical protein [Geobacter sulfurreducens]UAC05887.1 hypothetical protein KVP06_06835 [Geobacter sulfurreducens]